MGIKSRDWEKIGDYISKIKSEGLTISQVNFFSNQCYTKLTKTNLILVSSFRKGVIEMKSKIVTRRKFLGSSLGTASLLIPSMKTGLSYKELKKKEREGIPSLSRAV